VKQKYRGGTLKYKDNHAISILESCKCWNETFLCYWDTLVGHDNCSLNSPFVGGGMMRLE